MTSSRECQTPNCFIWRLGEPPMLVVLGVHLASYSLKYAFKKLFFCSNILVTMTMMFGVCFFGQLLHIRNFALWAPCPRPYSSLCYTETTHNTEKVHSESPACGDSGRDKKWHRPLQIPVTTTLFNWTSVLFLFIVIINIAMLVSSSRSKPLCGVAYK